MTHQALAGSTPHPGGGAAGAVPAEGGGADCREVAEIPVRVPEEESVRHRTAVTPVHLKIDEGLSRHPHQRDALVDEHRRDGQMQLLAEARAVVVKNLGAKGCDECLAEFFSVPARMESQEGLGEIEAGLEIGRASC